MINESSSLDTPSRSTPVPTGTTTLRRKTLLCAVLGPYVEALFKLTCPRYICPQQSGRCGLVMSLSDQCCRMSHAQVRLIEEPPEDLRNGHLNSKHMASHKQNYVHCPHSQSSFIFLIARNDRTQESTQGKYWRRVGDI